MSIKNQPQGSNAFGRLVDKIYLNSVGWRGIRQRKTHLQMLIKQAVADLHAKGLAVRVVDIAAGHGRYVLDALANEPAVSDIFLRDYSELNVAQGARDDCPTGECLGGCVLNRAMRLTRRSSAR